MCRTKLQPYGWRVIFNHRQKVLLNSLFWLTRWSQVRSSCHVSLESTCLAVILHLTSCWILSFVTFVVICCWLVLEKCVANRSGDCLYSGWSSIYPKSCLLHPECLSYTSKFWLDFRIFLQFIVVWLWITHAVITLLTCVINYVIAALQLCGDVCLLITDTKLFSGHFPGMSGLDNGRIISPSKPFKIVEWNISTTDLMPFPIPIVSIRVLRITVL